MRTPARLLVVATFTLGCGGAQQPRQDSIEQQWRGLLAQCKVDPLICKRRCDGGEQLACSVLTNETVAAKLKDGSSEPSTAGSAPDAAVGDAGKVVEILPSRLPKKPSNVASAASLLAEIASLEEMLRLRKDPKPLTMRLARTCTDLALFSGPAEPDAQRRVKLIRLGAKKALLYWSTAIGSAFEPETAEVDYTTALLNEVIDQRDEARAGYMKIVETKSPLVPHALFGLAVLFERDGHADYAKQALVKCVEIPPWENPLWDLARKRAGLPEGYETAAMIARRRAAEKAAAEAKVAGAFGLVSASADEIATMRFKVRLAKRLAMTKSSLKAIPLMEAEANRKVKDEYCVAKQTFVDEHGPQEFATRANEHCASNAPSASGAGGAQETLTAECQAIVATACATTPTKDAAFVKMPATPKPSGGCVSCFYNAMCRRLQNKPGDCCEPITESVDGPDGAKRCREIEAKKKP